MNRRLNIGISENLQCGNTGAKEDIMTGLNNVSIIRCTPQGRQDIPDSKDYALVFGACTLGRQQQQPMAMKFIVPGER